MIRRDGTPVEISGRVFDALRYFVEHAGSPIARTDLFEALWPNTIVEDNSLNKVIAALRRALGDDGQRYIVTIQGRGYQFVGHVRAIAEPPEAVPPDAAPPARPAATAAPVRAPAPLASSARRVAAGAALALLVAIALLGVLSSWRPDGAPRPTVGTVVRTLPATSYPGDEESPSLSPDGRQMVFSWDGGAAGEGNGDIYISVLGSSAAPLRLTHDPLVDRDPAWSPDGTTIAFLRQQGPSDFDLMVVPSLGGPERKLYSIRVWIDLQLRNAEPPLAWSPDSAYVVFTSRTGDPIDADSYHLYALSIATGEVVRLSSDVGVYDSSPAVSPDGRWLAFSRFAVEHAWTSQLLVQRLGRGMQPVGPPIAVPSGPSGAPHSPQWLSDSRRLLLVNGGTLFESEVGGKAIPVYTASVTPGTVQYRGFSLHHEAGRSRAVLVVETALSDIFALPLDPESRRATGPPKRLIASSGVDNQPQFSPDGRRFAFVSRRSGRAGIWLADENGGNETEVASFDATLMGWPRWSPDGSQISFHAAMPGGARQIYLVPSTGGIARPFTSGCCADWSPDGRYLYVAEIAVETTEVRVAVADGAREPLFEGTLSRITLDGTRLLYSKTEERGIFTRSVVADAANNPETKLVDDYVPPLGGIAVTDDGFYYVGHTPAGLPRALRFYDTALGASRDVDAPLPPRTAQGLSLSPDGRTLLYAASADSGADIVGLYFE